MSGQPLDFKSAFLKHCKESKSIQTYRQYKSGLLRFETYYGKDMNQVYLEHVANKLTHNPIS